MTTDSPNVLSPNILMVPTHPGVQYHFCRVGLPTHFLGNWDQFHYWRPKPDNVVNVLPAFDDAHLDFEPADYARLLQDPEVGFPERYDLAWLMFNWQFKLFREHRDIKKLYRVSKVRELEHLEWVELLERDDFTVVSFYPSTVEWAKETHGVDIPYIPLGLDPDSYGGWTGEDGTILSIIHSYEERGWHYPAYREATEGLPTLHIDHLDPEQEVYEYADIMRALKRSRLYLHDGEQEYTITLIEAMMTGMPLVTFRLPNVERYVVHGENGFVCDTAEEIREACQLLLSDDALAAKMGAASRKKAVAEFHEERWRAQWVEAISDYLAAP